MLKDIGYYENARAKFDAVAKLLKRHMKRNILLHSREQKSKRIGIMRKTTSASFSEMKHALTGAQLFQSPYSTDQKIRKTKPSAVSDGGLLFFNRKKGYSYHISLY
ncbi:hypothetical protein [Phaeobacter gallaeciensis]|uniref:hypothetical protein n=1 Tax=Phaeobacter gallaeciensis TaxID=60890 RepID=UPI00237F8038|nr:hypothetical protein [Phaeobacter gallaeciensis]MDE4126267.1 hypothetical protein [Phaeobacter gallaeciensis]MDE4130683.1 hypothetical protein [Phaeobacter gallaeciensis]